jgi:hypothetical protein
MNVVTRMRIVERTLGATQGNAYDGARRKTGVVAVEIQCFASKPGSGYREPHSPAVWNCDLHDRITRPYCIDITIARDTGSMNGLPKNIPDAAAARKRRRPEKRCRSDIGSEQERNTKENYRT